MVSSENARACLSMPFYLSPEYGNLTKYYKSASLQELSTP